MPPSGSEDPDVANVGVRTLGRVLEGETHAVRRPIGVKLFERELLEDVGGVGAVGPNEHQVLAVRLGHDQRFVRLHDEIAPDPDWGCRFSAVYVLSHHVEDRLLPLRQTVLHPSIRRSFLY